MTYTPHVRPLLMAGDRVRLIIGYGTLLAGSLGTVVWTEDNQAQVAWAGYRYLDRLEADSAYLATRFPSHDANSILGLDTYLLELIP